MSEPITCYYCSDEPTAREYRDFQEALDLADDENENEWDELLQGWQGNEEERVDKDFYVCMKDLSEIQCAECHNLLTRGQIINLLNQGDYNRLNEGLCQGPAACTDCWIEHDYELRCELGIEEKKEEFVSLSSYEERLRALPPLPPSPVPENSEEKPKGRWDHQITLNEIKNQSHEIPQWRIQEENVRYGMARCKRETKDKSIKKLQTYLESHPNPRYIDTPKQESCEIVIDKTLTFTYEYPQGKTKEDLQVLLKQFFEPK